MLKQQVLSLNNKYIVLKKVILNVLFDLILVFN